MKISTDFENKIIDRCKSDKPEIIESILSSGKLEENLDNNESANESLEKESADLKSEENQKEINNKTEEPTSIEFKKCSKIWIFHIFIKISCRPAKNQQKLQKFNLK